MGGVMHLRRWFPRVLFAAGLLLVVQGSYLPLKAALAQALIAASWQQRSDEEPARNPWPWADTRPVARLSVPRLGVSQFVMQDDSGESLAFGPGLLPESADKAGVNTIIAGHRDTHFAFLGDLRPGDRLVVEDETGHSTHWRVRQSNVFDARVGLVLPGDGQSLRLVTCWPLDAVVQGPLRLQVVAEPADAI